MTVKLEGWSVTTSAPNPWIAPEMVPLRLMGSVTGHPKFEDGTEVMTGSVISCNGRQVVTKSTEYVLGSPSPEYREWLRKNRPNWDEENPITLVKDLESEE